MDSLRQSRWNFWASDVCAVAAYIDSVVFPQAAVLADRLFIYGDVAEDHGQIGAGIADCIAVIGKVFCVGIDLPQVAKDVAADTEFGKRPIRRPLRGRGLEPESYERR